MELAEFLLTKPHTMSSSTVAEFLNAQTAPGYELVPNALQDLRQGTSVSFRRASSFPQLLAPRDDRHGGRGGWRRARVYCVS